MYVIPTWRWSVFYKLIIGSVLIACSFWVTTQVTLAAPITPGSFSTTWKTDNPGTSGSNQITIPTTGGGYNYDVYWEEVGNDTNNGSSTGHTGDLTITFPNIGTYRVDITGAFPQIWHNASVDAPKLLTIEQWGSIVWRSFNSAFWHANNLTVPATDAPDLSQVTDLSNMFNRAFLMNQPINHWDVSNVTSMSRMFEDARAFNQPLDNWDVSNVTNFGDMFAMTTAFNQPLNNWNVSNAISVGSMFRGATAFNQPLNNWNVSSVSFMREMFRGATAFNQPLNNWNVSSVVDMYQMFSGATAFNQPLNNWNVSSVVDMYQMFSGATAFNQPLNNWNVSSVTTMYQTFAFANAFNQPLNNWNVSSVTNMQGMFLNASAFNQSLSSWNIANVNNLQDIFANSGFQTLPYSATLTGWGALPSVQSSLNTGTVPAAYCSTASSSRTRLVSTFGWTISDSGAVGCYSVTYASGLNATLMGVGSQTIISGQNTSAVEIIPDAGYRFVRWSDNRTDNPRTDTNVTADISVSAVLEQITYSVTYLPGSNATISGQAAQTIISGQNTSAVEIIPDAGYRFVRWSDNRTDNPRTDTNVTADISVSAVVELIVTYNLTYTSGANATLIGVGSQSVTAGSDGTSVEIIPDSGYEFIEWSDGVTSNPRVDANVSADITVTAVVTAIATTTATSTATTTAPSSGGGGGGGGSSKRNQNNVSDTASSTTVFEIASTTENVENATFMDSVTNLLRFLEINQDTVKSMPEEEKKKMILLLQSIIAYLMSLLVELKA